MLNRTVDKKKIKKETDAMLNASQKDRPIG